MFTVSVVTYLVWVLLANATYVIWGWIVPSYTPRQLFRTAFDFNTSNALLRGTGMIFGLYAGLSLPIMTATRYASDTLQLLWLPRMIAVGFIVTGVLTGLIMLTLPLVYQRYKHITSTIKVSVLCFVTVGIPLMVSLVVLTFLNGHLWDMPMTWLDHAAATLLVVVTLYLVAVFGAMIIADVVKRDSVWLFTVDLRNTLETGETSRRTYAISAIFFGMLPLVVWLAQLIMQVPTIGFGRYLLAALIMAPTATFLVKYWTMAIEQMFSSIAKRDRRAWVKIHMALLSNTALLSAVVMMVTLSIIVTLMMTATLGQIFG